MAQGYKLVLRPSERKQRSQRVVLCCVEKYRFTDLRRLCKPIAARSTVSSADVKS